MKIIGNGSITKCIETAADTTAIYAGKPNKEIIDIMMDRHRSIEKNKTVFIGDNLYTDILFANGAGIDSVLVLTGVTYKEELERELSKPDSGRPTYVFENLS